MTLYMFTRLDYELDASVRPEPDRAAAGAGVLRPLQDITIRCRRKQM